MSEYGSQLELQQEIALNGARIKRCVFNASVDIGPKALLYRLLYIDR